MVEEQPKAKAIYCPNCQQLASMSGNEITCENCDAIFVITKKQGAKLKQIGAIEEIRERMDRIEARFPGEEQPPEDEPPEPVEEPEEPIL